MNEYGQQTAHRGRRLLAVGVAVKPWLGPNLGEGSTDGDTLSVCLAVLVSHNVDDTTLEDFTRPLTKGEMFVDLRNGHIFEVVAISKVEDADKQSPKEKVHTRDGPTLSDVALENLRVRCKHDKGYPYAIWP